MTTTQKAIDVHSLLRFDEGRVHSDVYASPEVFELEVEKIFHRGWVYVGHESEVPQNGDYVLRWIGRQNVIMNRDDLGHINLFMNRCRHRANSVCQFEQGNSAFFRCAYHGWTYKNSGELVGLPFSQGAYGPEFHKEDFPLVPAPRMGIYRGFVWGSLAAGGPSLDDHLGMPAKHAIDLFCDHSPEGEVVVRQGANKSTIYANWKFQGGDGYHPPFTHQASFMSMRAARQGRANPLGAGGRGRMEDGFLSRDLGNGHYCLDLRNVNRGGGRGRGLPDTAWAKDYQAAMVKSYGKERADFIINSGGPHTILMPNVQLLNPDIRVLRAIAADHLEINFHLAFLKGVPEEINVMRLRDTEGRMGPAGSINVDDVDMFERNQLGMQQTVDPWKYMARGMTREHVDADERTPEPYRMAGTLAGHYSDEVTQRAQLRWWAAELSKP